jgi:uncharacterized protein HemX
MTPEQRFDRLERIVKLMIKAGLRARVQSREQNEKINIIIDAQMRNEERFARNEQRFAQNEERFAQNEERFARLAESQAHADRRIEALIDIVRGGRNGKASN